MEEEKKDINEEILKDKFFLKALNYGDDECITLVFYILYKKIFKYAYCLISNKEEVKDITFETFTIFINNVKGYIEEIKFPKKFIKNIVDKNNALLIKKLKEENLFNSSINDILKTEITIKNKKIYYIKIMKNKIQLYKESKFINNIENFISSICFRKCMDYFRKKYKEKEYLEGVKNIENNNSIKNEEGFMGILIQEIEEKLSNDDLKTFFKLYLKGYKINEISEIMKIIPSRAYYLSKLLKKELYEMLGD